MNKTRFLTLMVVALVLLNLATIAFFAVRRPPKPEGPRRIVIEKLHFDDRQVAEYEKMIARHRVAVEAEETQIRDAKQELYSQLSSDDLSKKDSLIGRIGALHEDMERIHFDHFKEIKSLCTGEQIAQFNNLAKELAGYFAPGRGPGRAKKPDQ
jgi:hypothetical protein